MTPSELFQVSRKMWDYAQWGEGGSKEDYVWLMHPSLMDDLQRWGYKTEEKFFKQREFTPLPQEYFMMEAVLRARKLWGIPAVITETVVTEKDPLGLYRKARLELPHYGRGVR